MNGHGADAMTTRRELLADVPVTDVTMTVAGVDTSVLVGGAGSPMVLLHGPGEHAATWLPVLDQLVDSHRIIVPDLPGHGATGAPDRALTRTWVERWLESLVAATCSEPPVLVGRVTGGGLAARFVAAHPGTVAHLVLVDSTGLAPFDPDPRFGLALERYSRRPVDDDASRGRWTSAPSTSTPPARASATDGRRTPTTRWPWCARRGSRPRRAPSSSSTPPARSPRTMLERIDAPTTLIWGRHDLATPLHVAETASELHGWPLHVIDGAGDDPPLDQPGSFVEAILAAVRAATGARQ